jgi:multidrug efflux pump subunit AcrA (membrane-fusion protein)
MLVKPRRHMQVLSISALDLFASALGVFVLIAILLFPYYLKQPSQQAEVDGARAELSSMGEALEAVRLTAREAAEARAEAAAQLQQAQGALANAESLAANAGQSRDAAQQLADAAAAKMASVQSQPDANFAMPDLDLVFVMDVTGSMDDEIRDVQSNLLGLIRVLTRLAPTLNVGFVAFKDRGDDYLVRSFPLTAMRGGNLSRIQAFVERLEASGGGDVPEPVAYALEQGIAMSWRPEAEGRIVLIGDAPSHRPDWGAAFGQAAAFSATSSEAAPGTGTSRRTSAIFTGKRAEGREFFERLADAGRGDFVQHRGQMMESVLLSVLDDTVSWKRKGAGP